MIYLMSAACFIIGLILGVITNMMLNKLEAKPEPELLEFTELMNIINWTINNVWTVKYENEYLTKKMVVFADMQAEIRKISSAIIMSFGEEFTNQITNYYTREYFYTYIVRAVEAKLTEYLKQYGPRSK